MGWTFPALEEGHVAVDACCPLCPDRLGNGQAVVQIAVGPIDEESARADARGEDHTACAVLAHGPCASHFSEPEIVIALRDIGPPLELVGGLLRANEKPVVPDP